MLRIDIKVNKCEKWEQIGRLAPSKTVVAPSGK